VIEFDDKVWTAQDPDGMLSLKKSDLSCFACDGKISPREDLLQFKHRMSGIVVDYGYYGSDVELNGSWIVYVITEASPEGWDLPLEKHSFSYNNFVKSTNCVQTILEKYT